jgi:hypothetical protein
MSSVTFDVAVGGDGSTVTDDNNATTGLREGGWKTRFVPCFTQQVAVANYIVTKAGEASTSASAASSSATAAAASYDSFDDRYLGAKTSDPSVDNDGNALLTGAIYWNTASNVMKVWSGSAWVSYNPAISYLPLTGGTMTGAITFAAGQFGTNVNTFLSTPSSANLAAALTDETGTGVSVFNNTPTLITPILGTPTSGNLSNCTNAVAYGLKSATTTLSVSGATAPTSGQALIATSSTEATWQSLPSSIASIARIAKTSAYTIVAGDKGTLIEVTSGTFTLSLTAAATLGSGWWCYLSTWVQWTNEIGLLQCNGTGFYYYQMQKGTITQTVSSAVASIVFSGCLAYRRSMILSWDSGALSANDQVKFLLNTSETPSYSGGYVDQGTSIYALTASTDNFTLGNSHGSGNTGVADGMNGQAIITLSDNVVEANITSKYITPASRVDRGQTLSLFSSVTRTSITNITIIPNSANFTGGTFTLKEL